MPTLVDHLHRTATEHPAAEALRYQGRSLDYAGLDRTSSALAATLREGGVRPGHRVGMWTDKSIETVVAIHAVLKCGAAYVPVDPMAPPARAAYILEDCGVSALVTDAARLALLDERNQTSTSARFVVVIGEPVTGEPQSTPTGTATALGGVGRTSWQAAVQRRIPGDFRLASVADGDLAYVLYTSGSTGVPKGVMLSHRNAAVFVEWAVAEFGIGPDDRLSSHAPLHFDLSVLDLFAAARAGACLVLVPENHKALGVALNRLVAEERITVWYSVPGALVRMLDAKNHGSLTASGLRTVLFAGEGFPVKHLRRLRDVLPRAELYNLYGPTETNVCTFHRVTDEDLAPDRITPPPIGRPCPYATAHLLDADGRVIKDEPGAEGELRITGDSVMLGYWGATPHGASTDEVSTGHRTGDIVRSEEARGYSLLGRRDHMVKIRGYRIELEEIEATLLKSPAVHEAACVMVQEEEAAARLVAYVVPVAGVHPGTAELRRQCLEDLPRYMMPARFHVVEELPRTSTGKTDRRALAARRGESACPSLS